MGSRSERRTNPGRRYIAHCRRSDVAKASGIADDTELFPTRSVDDGLASPLETHCRSVMLGGSHWLSRSRSRSPHAPRMPLSPRLRPKMQVDVDADLLVPIIRMASTLASFSIGEQSRVFALYHDRILIFDIKGNQAIPQAAYERGGAEALRSLKPRGRRLDVALESISLVTATRSGRFTHPPTICFEVVSTDETERFELPAQESPHLILGLKTLLGDRFSPLPTTGEEGENSPADGDAGKAAAQIAGRDEPRKVLVARQPYRSQRLGALCMVAGFAWIALGLWALIRFSDPLTHWLRQVTGVDGIPSQAAVLGFSLLILPGAFCYLFGQRLRLPDAREALLRDPRAPILYLRSFADDGLPGPDQQKRPAVPVTSVQTLLGFFRFLRGRDSMTWEQEFALFFRSKGPVVAIGKPGEKITVPGAMRMYVDDDDWQATVLRLIDSSQAVILRLSPTAGAWWEFQQCRARLDPKRLLLLLTYVEASQQRYEELRIRMEPVLGHPLPRSTGSAMFVRFDDDWTPRLDKLSFRSKWLWDLDSILDLKNSLKCWNESLEAAGHHARDDTT
ncbi:MAG: hypothetical protein P4L85_23335 [Paludisphaera borealis]|uniref:hypothetical protein n=1 Tax=Paludisphaera borealis TaxID=1387353 RepID=UPI00283BCF8A|nr:hypothetical protein [Paludisphaera borealis]MDR3622304.1 hypothetical protein [Paludisphaera borealis]